VTGPAVQFATCQVIIQAGFTIFLREEFIPFLKVKKALKNKAIGSEYLTYHWMRT
jgi:hypothetical protein